jgi:hypothetical protein
MTLTVAQAVERLFDNTGLRISAFDGSTSGPADGWPTHIASERWAQLPVDCAGLARACSRLPAG